MAFGFRWRSLGGEERRRRYAEEHKDEIDMLARMAASSSGPSGIAARSVFGAGEAAAEQQRNRDFVGRERGPGGVTLYDALRREGLSSGQYESYLRSLTNQPNIDEDQLTRIASRYDTPGGRVAKAVLEGKARGQELGAALQPPIDRTPEQIASIQAEVQGGNVRTPQQGPFNSMLFPEQIDAATRRLPGPVQGPARRSLSFLTSPAGVASLGVAPVATLAGEAGSVALGTAGEALNVPTPVQYGLEALGGTYGGGRTIFPGLFGAGERRAGRAAQEAAQGAAEAAARNVPEPRGGLTPVHAIGPDDVPRGPLPSDLPPGSAPLGDVPVGPRAATGADVVPSGRVPAEAPGDFVGDLSYSIGLFDRNSQEASRFLKENIIPAFNERFGDFPNMDIKLGKYPSGGEPLLRISEAGWRDRAAQMGLEFAGEDGYGSLWRMPGLDLPSSPPRITGPRAAGVQRPAASVEAPPARGLPSDLPPGSPPVEPPRTATGNAGGVPPTEPPVTRGALPEPNVPTPQGSPVERLTQIINDAKPVRAQTEQLYKQELRRRAGAVAGTIENAQGQGGLGQALGQLKGELPKAQFEPPRGLLDQAEVDDLFDTIWRSQSRPFEKVNAAEALQKVVMTGQVPTRGEIALLEQHFGKELAQAILSKRSFGTKAWENFMDLVNLPRAVMSAWDASAPLRQGVILTIAHPTESFPAMGAMFRSMGDGKYAQQVDDAIRAGDNFALKQDSGLYLAPFDSVGPLTAREETFMSRLADKIPGIRQSQRGYVTYLNKLRSDVFDVVDKNWQGLGKTEDDYKSLSNFLNHASGRGDLGPASNLAPILNATFFSPRLLMSRFQVAADVFTSTPSVRKLVARDLLAFVGTGMTVLTMAKLSGIADVDVDPRSTDFGKLRMGRQRIDFWGGFQPIARYTAQILTGQRRTAGGDIVGTARGDVVARFLRSKLAPVPGTLETLRSGKSFAGQDVELTTDTLKSQTFNNLVPLFIQDLIESAQQEGMIGLARAVPAGLGVGVLAYQSQEEKAQERFEELGIPFDADTWRTIARQDERLQDLAPPGDDAQRRDEIVAQEAAELFPDELIAGVRAGNPDAGARFREAYSNFVQRRIGATNAIYFGKDFGDPTTEAGKIAEELYSLQAPLGEDFVPDYDALDQQREALLARMRAISPEWVTAYENSLKLPEELQDVELRYKAARVLRNEVADMSPVRGVSAEEYSAVQDLVRDAQRRQEEMRRNEGRDVPIDRLIIQVGREQGVDSRTLKLATRLNGAIPDRMRDREYDRFLLAHQDELLTFYPELYRRKALQLGSASGEPVYQTAAQARSRSRRSRTVFSGPELPQAPSLPQLATIGR